ncbi:DUF3048 domain-containing protein [Alkalibaculum sp. M08DMB]|uniref:DUF3048 domain-containing protein n=1 Tax=Alkalibaculum sporogenes TaxID=2655001 RepID=A0A6A7K894_9FIRM|nr:DUF3048 domain-containing protein [Alkalibaculum sporogenes]MPW25541.1 DUF3048 domain-containing protein [Alkalibaculum sporogenes]
MKKIFNILIITLTLLLLFAACSKKTESPTPQTPGETPGATTDPIMNYKNVTEGFSPLTGLPHNGDGRAIIVQIENTPGARPQSGITKADLIYEMEVESNITRLTAFFLSEYPQKVGPVRSVRKQQIQLWSEWDYLYTFFGGSEYEPGQNIYQIKEELGIESPSLNGHKGGGSFSRAQDRKSPHNAYTDLTYTIENIYNNYSPQLRTIYFIENAKMEGDTAKEITFSYRSDNNVKYVYNDNNYDRFINEEPMVDKESNDQLVVKNIIIQYAPHYKVTDTVYTNIDLIGSGEAEYFTDGIKRIGRWERKDEDSLTIYYDDNGAEIPFKPGVTFIQIVREDTEVTVK